jgi:mono/diheme cytochrome c family protein
MRFALALLILSPLSLQAQPQGAGDSALTPEAVEFFEKSIRPVLADRCYSCHSASAPKLKGGLRLDTREGLRKGGETGPALVPGDPDRSLLIRAILRGEDAEKMPPKDSERLSPEQIRDFKAWVKMGAPDPRTPAAAAAAPKPAINFEEARRRWPFNPVAEPALPAVADASWPRSPIDRFILAKLEEKRLRPARDADPRTLLRRVSFDLTGLPPTPEEIDAFLADSRPEALSRVVERLLASPAYGERWGRHWLDVVRYSDSAGDNSDFPVPQIYKYRNYVINAFNKDTPYDRFIVEQIAGDLLHFEDEAERARNLVATGYIANARRFGSVVDDYPWHLTIEDTIDNMGRTFLGLTASCTRCHDHKFDPLTNEDYYALYGIFESTRYPWPGIELQQYQRDFVPLAPVDQVEKVAKEREAKQAALDAGVRLLEAEKKVYDASAGSEPDGEGARLKQYAEQIGKEIDSVKKEKAKILKTPLPYETLYAVAEAKKTGNSKVQIKGDPTRLGREIPRRFFEVLGGQPISSEVKGSGRHQLAEWIADPANPLTARVMVNRLWHYHFGKGIVQTPSDFGRQGRPPTHPELLDWLARRFVESGWSIKSMHRLILSSHAYRVSCEEDAAGAAADAGDDLLWKFRRRRLEAEAIRDSLLAVSGGLDRHMGGAHPIPSMATWEYTEHKPFLSVYDHNLRSVYLLTQRISRHPFLGTFDGAETNAGTPARVTSTTSLQALSLLNDPFFHEQAAAFAARLLKERPEDDARIERAYLLALGRPPSEQELCASRDYVHRIRARLDEKQAWESFARIVFRLSEFVYVR